MHAGSLSLDTFLSRRSAERRLARLTHDVGLPEGRGLEFGAASKPTPLPDGLRVTYLAPAVDTAVERPETVQADYAWAGSTSLADRLGRTDYDFAIAAHAAHRVPNLLGWFRGIYAVLRPGGVLNLSLPDRRYTSDVSRRESTIAELVEADLLAYEHPSPRQIFAHTYETRTVDPAAIWDGLDVTQTPRLFAESALPLAHARAAEALASANYSLADPAGADARVERLSAGLHRRSRRPDPAPPPARHRRPRPGWHSPACRSADNRPGRRPGSGRRSRGASR